jgi:hypothetical protein
MEYCCELNTFSEVRRRKKGKMKGKEKRRKKRNKGKRRKKEEGKKGNSWKGGKRTRKGGNGKRQKEEEKNVSRVCKKTFYFKLIIRLRDGSKGAPRRNLQTRPQNENFPNKKYVWYLKSVKVPKVRMEATQRNLHAARHKIFKNLLEHQINQSERKSSQKKYIKYLKKVESQKFVWELRDGICRLNPKS